MIHPLTFERPFAWREWQAHFLPEMERGSWLVRKFDTRKEILSIAGVIEMAKMQMEGRGIPNGEYTKLVCTEIEGKDHNVGVVMSDTPTEINDTIPMLKMAILNQASRVLIHGLGLGIVPRMLAAYGVDYIDVVELEEDVIEMVGPYVTEEVEGMGCRLFIHHGDALTYKFPRGTRWDIVWHDIWPDISDLNIPQMTKLKRRYANVCRWQGCWSEDEARKMRRIYEGKWTQKDIETTPWLAAAAHGHTKKSLSEIKKKIQKIRSSSLTTVY